MYVSFTPVNGNVVRGPLAKLHVIQIPCHTGEVSGRLTNQLLVGEEVLPTGWVRGKEYRRVHDKDVEPTVDPNNFGAFSLGWKGNSKALVTYLQFKLGMCGNMVSEQKRKKEKASKVHVLTVCYGCDVAVGQMAGNRRDSVVGVQEGCIFRGYQGSNLAEKRTRSSDPERTKSVVVCHCGMIGERGLARG